MKEKYYKIAAGVKPAYYRINDEVIYMWMDWHPAGGWGLLNYRKYDERSFKSPYEELTREELFLELL